MGLGFVIMEKGGNRGIYHNGEWPGARSFTASRADRAAWRSWSILTTVPGSIRSSPPREDYWTGWTGYGSRSPGWAIMVHIFDWR
jgi:hypothetical protein